MCLFLSVLASLSPGSSVQLTAATDLTCKKREKKRCHRYFVHQSNNTFTRAPMVPGKGFKNESPANSALSQCLEPTGNWDIGL